MTGLEYILKLKDQFSPQMVKAAGIADSAAMRIQRNMNNLNSQSTRSANMAGRAVQGVTERIRTLGRTDPSAGIVNGFQRIRMEADKTNRTLDGGGMSGGVFGKLAKRFAIGAAITGGLMFGKGAFTSAMNYEGTAKSYEVLTGSKARGNGLAADLNRLQQDTILGPEVFKSGQTLLGFGLNADKVLPTIKMLGDVAMGDAERFNALTLAFAQMTAAGRLQGQDLLQMVNAGFNPLLVISKQTGKSMLELRKQMEDGAISSQMIAKAFETATGKGGQFYNMMQQMGETAKGRMAQAQGSFEAMKIAIGERLSPTVGSLTKSFANLFDTVKGWFEIPVQDKIIREQQGVIGLVSVITKLNEGNQERKRLLGELVSKYPDLFGNIDIEKIKNSELLKTLNDVNMAYEKRIGIAVSEGILAKNQKSANKYWQMYVEKSTEAELKDREASSYSEGTRLYNQKKDKANRLKDRANEFLEKYKSFENAADIEDKVLRMKKVMAFGDDPTQMAGIKNATDKKKFTDTISQFKNKGMSAFTSWDTLTMMENIMKGEPAANAAMPGGGDKSGSKGVGQAKAMADSINSGGQRPITINIQKQVGAENIHVMNGKEAANEIESLVREAMRRMLLSLNGGAVA